ncbi:DUF2290 domain-containing protein [Bacillus paramycoides]|uniref:DUF2290 domain-containing protein n=1 Tax=Bacillus paramycoides TaxID=2026194 RepID=UPI003CFE3128
MVKTKELVITSEKELVINQLTNLYLVQEKIPNINNSKIQEIKENSVGRRTPKFTIRTYVEVYRDMLLNEKYNLLLNDDSIIDFHYEFNDEGKIIGHNLSFIPGLDAEISLNEDMPNMEDQIMILITAANYLRIDYDLTGKKNIVHTDVHMHYGLFERGEKGEGLLSELRIPIEGILYPYEFIYIVLKYIYEVSDDDLQFLLDFEYSKKHCLEECEFDKLILSFDRKSYQY